MARIRLTDRFVQSVKTTKTQEDFWDETERGFGLRVTQQGRKTWVVRYRTPTRRRRESLGTYPAVSLEAARRRSREIIGQVSTGADPVRDRRVRDATARSFRDVADLYINRYAVPNKRPRSVQEDRRIIFGSPTRKSDLAGWYDLPLAAIGVPEVVDVLDAIMDRGSPVMANRTRALLSKLFDFALSRGIVASNPVKATQRPLKQEAPRSFFLDTDEDLRAFWAATSALRPDARDYFRLLLLTGQRPGEVLGMWRTEVHGHTWRLPGARTKNGLAHEVPLAPAAEAIVRGRLRTTDGPLFPGRTPNASRRDFNAATRSLRKRLPSHLQKWTPHSLRRTATTHLIRPPVGANQFLVSLILNHKDRTVTGAYNMHDYFEEKDKALTAWADRLLAIVEASGE